MLLQLGFFLLLDLDLALGRIELLANRTFLALRELQSSRQLLLLKISRLAILLQFGQFTFQDRFLLLPGLEIGLDGFKPLAGDGGVRESGVKLASGDW